MSETMGAAPTLSDAAFRALSLCALHEAGAKGRYRFSCSSLNIKTAAKVIHASSDKWCGRSYSSSAARRIFDRGGNPTGRPTNVGCVGVNESTSCCRARSLSAFSSATVIRDSLSSGTTKLGCLSHSSSEIGSATAGDSSRTVMHPVYPTVRVTTFL